MRTPDKYKYVEHLIGITIIKIACQNCIKM